MIQIYYTRIREDVSVNLSHYLPLMDESIKAKIMKLKRPHDKQASLLGRLMLLELLKNNGLCAEGELSAWIYYNDYGRPYLRSGSDFNISHSGNLIVCAFNPEGPIGIDIEEIKGIAIEEFRNIFSHNEWSALSRSVNVLNDFYRSWVVKEAVAKAVGYGLSLPLNRITENGEDGIIVKDSVWFPVRISIDSAYAACFVTNNNNQRCTVKKYFWDCNLS